MTPTTPQPAITEDFIDSAPASTPNVPAGTTHLPLHPITLWPVGFVDSVLVFPGALDRERLKAAVRSLTEVWPNLCGRYVRRGPNSNPDESEFAIHLTQSPIKLETLTVEADYPYPDTNVVQPGIGPYAASLPQNFHLPDSDSSLFALRLTTLLPSGRSVLGVTVSHVFADGATGNRILHHLSHFYHHGTALSPESLPTFFPHIHLPNYPPSHQVIEENLVGQVVPRDLSEVHAGYTGGAVGSEQTTVRLSRKELAMIRGGSGSTQKLSDQDLLSGWWITLLERIGEQKIDRIIYTINYRNLVRDHPSFPATLPTLSANVSQMRLINVAEDAADTTSSSRIIRSRDIAETVRSELVRLRTDHTTTLNWLSTAAAKLEEAAMNGQGQLILPPPGEVMINSNLRYDWTPSFGFPARTVNFHTGFSMPRVMRVFEANPASMNGEPLGEEVGIEIIFNVDKSEDTKQRLHDALKEDRRRWESA